MTFKDNDKKKEYQKRYYEAHKEEWATRQRERRRTLAQWIRSIKVQRGCSKCSENHPSCLDFHHRDEAKEIDISEMITNKYSEENILEEIAKCDVLCANCHRKAHWQD